MKSLFLFKLLKIKILNFYVSLNYLLKEVKRPIDYNYMSDIGLMTGLVLILTSPPKGLNST